MTTAYAPAARASASELEKQTRLFTENRLAGELLRGLPDIFMVLNECRQIVYANEAVVNVFGLDSVDKAYGLRPGEAANCVHACEAAGGCGTTEFCSVCGAVNAIMGSRDGNRRIAECRILQESGDALDLRVWATPLELAGEQFTVFALVDISDEKRRRVLERIFFHDILNTAGGLVGFTELLEGASQEEIGQYRSILAGLSRRLVEEIQSQQQLAAAESGDLVPNLTEFSAEETLREVVALFSNHEVAAQRRLVLGETSAGTMVNDRALLQRVLGNMVKNALEASTPGQTVTASMWLEEDSVEFCVHNELAMPRAVQLQVFQRSFSTKGANRGLGTYGMKLISERYLGGSISFRSNEADGTSFVARYPRLGPPQA